MLRITIPEFEIFDETKEEFIYIKPQTLQLEHSLVAISEWESKWHKPCLGAEEKTQEETLDYIRCMTITQNVNQLVYLGLTNEILSQITDYIGDSRTATWFRNDGSNVNNGEIVTSELIYYWMIALGIPSEYQKWHLNRLLTLIRVCNVKNAPPKKMSSREIARRNSEINKARRAKWNTRG